MSSFDGKERTKERAYFIWEAHGRPDGRALDHWLEAEGVLAAGPKQKPASVKKKAKAAKTTAKAAKKKAKTAKTTAKAAKKKVKAAKAAKKKAKQKSGSARSKSKKRS